MDWFSKIVQLFKIKDLRTKILFVLGIFVVFRLMANIPIPSIDAEGLRRLVSENQALGLLNLFTGGAMDNVSIVMLGLGPYITATIILQLLTMIFPALERLYKEEGEAGRRKFNQYGRMLTIPFAFVQGYGFMALLKSQNALAPNITSFDYLLTLITITGATMFLVWLGELITERGIGNGVSLLIFAGIVADLPRSIGQMITSTEANPTLVMNLVIFLAMALVIIMGVVFVTQARRNIPVSYAKRVRGNKMFGGVSTYLPLNINPAGVIPIIFALSLLVFPTMIAGFFQTAPGVMGDIAKSVQTFFTNQWIYGVLYFLLVGLFTFFYTAVTFDPKSISSNLQKMGGFIPGVRPGESTAHYIMYTLNRILFVGALFLGTIAVMPSIIQGFTRISQFSFLIGGTALLIVVSVVLETIRQIRAQMKMRDYESF
ncbi:MAG: preprotein translocase subunit SecY [Candidatus Wildermuthbacteria bacterium]|nr:preprotein translocase subunit SecY [Candidatus Wildermuthbacteria bacterium]